MISILLVITLVFATFAVIWTIRSKEWLQSLFVALTVIFVSFTNPGIGKSVHDFFMMVAKMIFDLFN